LLLTCGKVSAQYKSEKDATIPLENFYIERKKSGILRLLLSKVTLGVSTGYGHTAFRHDLDGFGILQDKNAGPQIFTSNNITTKFSNWFNTVTPNAAAPGASPFLVNSDTAKLGFRAKSFHIPLKATLHLEFDRYRIGAGYSYEITHIGNFNPISYSDKISPFAPQVSSFALKKYFVVLGAKVYRYNDYVLVVDANIGGYKLGSGFDQSLIQKGIFVNIGAAVERDMSEYFKLFVRPSYELRHYNLSIPESGGSITHHFNGYYLNIGATYRLPELRRCFMKGCHAQLNHAHGNREYRSRMHPIYKKQNPHYGENYPTLIKYKGRNKRKLNPY
jgi:hypothetical protein